MQSVLIGFGASAAAGLATGLGALAILILGKLSPRVEDAMLGFAAGVMLAASFFSLIQPALDAAGAQSQGSSMIAAFIVVAAILVGSACLFLLNRYLPHEHFVSGRNGKGGEKLHRIWLFVIAITLHNLPEGLAVGVGFGGGDMANGVKLATAIGLQNVPEGLAVAAALASIGYSRGVAVLIATATGLVEPVGGLAGAALASISQVLLPWALGFAAGAMLFVISNEIIPETHSRGNESVATGSLMLGLSLMTVLDTSFG